VNEELLYLMAFKKFGNVGDKTLDNLYRKFGSFKSAWHADDENIRELRLQKKISASLLEGKKRTKRCTFYSVCKG
jgi:predicted Rossmann fold nucleotide-binding protein DprA/Smf involved in DNA uptake